METKKCERCGKEFTGRSDKKFCSDNCRKNQHQKKNAMVAQTVQERTANPKKYAEKNPSDEFLQTLFPDASTKAIRILSYKHARLEEMQALLKDIETKESVQKTLDFIMREITLREAVELSRNNDGLATWKEKKELDNFLIEKEKQNERIKKYMEEVNKKRIAAGKEPY